MGIFCILNSLLVYNLSEGKVKKKISGEDSPSRAPASRLLYKYPTCELRENLSQESDALLEKQEI